MHDGFELVKKKRKRKQKSHFVSFKPELSSEFLHSLTQKLSKAIEEFESSRFCFNSTHSIKDSLENLESSSIDEILCYGIGRFSESKSSLHQLAALCCFQKFFNSNVKIYDPIFSCVETELLKNLKFEVLSENEEGKRKITTNTKTLVYLPHCPKQLTNNFLWANWNINIKNFLIIGNSFSKIVQDNTQKVLEESAYYIWKIHSKTEEVVLEDNYHIDNIFNDLSLHYFNNSELTTEFFQKTYNKEPEYLTDTELITKEIKGIKLEDE